MTICDLPAVSVADEEDARVFNRVAALDLVPGRGDCLRVGNGLTHTLRDEKSGVVCVLACTVHTRNPFYSGITLEGRERDRVVDRAADGERCSAKAWRIFYARVISLGRRAVGAAAALCIAAELYR